uniref:Rab-GAP TBC domain-containing protein n=1 Tax=Steinernema glaseri TaxID=37863 RepID=A0A1I7Y4Z8_9BILA
MSSVYGHSSTSKSDAPSESEIELCESALAQRRSAHLPKLKEISTRVQPSMEDPSPQVQNMDDVEFVYSDCDSHGDELSKLYTYSEMEDWATNVHLFREYAKNREQKPFWCSYTEEQKRSILHDLIARLDTAQPDGRLEAARLALYILQGAYLDFVPDMENFDDNFELTEQFAGIKSFDDVGCGGHEKDLLAAGVKNAFFAYGMGLYQALCTMLMVEVDDPFDVKALGDVKNSRTSSAANSRSASNADLSECKKSVTIADNEALRVVLNCLYHMVESIRRVELTEDNDSLSDSDKEQYRRLRKQFLQELEAPLDSAGIPLTIVLFQMLPSFLHGSTPHFPMKKVVLLIWKCLLAILGGWDVLRQEKEAKRKSHNLRVLEDTLQIAGEMSSVSFGANEVGESGVNAKTRIVHGPRLISRQLACTSTDGAIRPDDDEIVDTADIKDSKLRLRSSAPDDKGEADCNDKDVTVKLEDAEIEKIEAETEPKTPTGDAASSGEQTPIAGTPPPSRPLKKRIMLPWTPKVSRVEIHNFLDNAREKWLHYKLPNDTKTVFGLPPTVGHNLIALRRNLYISLGENQIRDEKKWNRYIFSQKEQIELTKTERLYRQLLPNMCEYIVAILKMLLAALPSSKAKADAINILSDVLTPETDNIDILSNSMSMDSSVRNVLEVSVRVSIDVARHKEIIIEASSAILILLMKFFRLNHIYQFENFSRHLLFANCIPLILKFLDQNMCRYVQAKNELVPYNYPQAPLHYVRNHDQWPNLNMDNVDESEQHAQRYFVWRNVFATINLLRVLNKLTKWKHVRTMMLVVFKSAPILKRTLRVRLGILQLYVLKLLKMQARYLGRQWRRTNMEIISAIFSKVRHRLNDDWAYANETRSKSWDFQMEERALKYAIEKFNARRYGHLYPNFALGTEDYTGAEDFASTDADAYLEKIDMKDFEPVDNCLQSVLGTNHELSERFKTNYEQWVRREVEQNPIDWDQLLRLLKGYEDSQRS